MACGGPTELASGVFGSRSEQSANGFWTVPGGGSSGGGCSSTGGSTGTGNGSTGGSQVGPRPTTIFGDSTTRLGDQAKKLNRLTDQLEPGSSTSGNASNSTSTTTGSGSSGGGGGLPGAGTSPGTLSEVPLPTTSTSSTTSNSTSNSSNSSNSSSSSSGSGSTGGYQLDPSRLSRGADGLGGAGQTTSTASLPQMAFPSLGSAFQSSFNQALTASQASVEALKRFVETNRLKLTVALAEYLAVESGNSALFGTGSGSGTGTSGGSTSDRTPLADGGSLLSLLLYDGIPFTEAVFQGFDNPTTPTPTSGGVENDGITAGEYGKGEGDAFLGKDVPNGAAAYQAGHQSLQDAGLPGGASAGSSSAQASSTSSAAFSSTPTSGLSAVIASNTKAFNQGTVYGFFHPDAPTPSTGGAYNDGVTLAQYCSGLTAAIENVPPATGSIAYQLGYYLTKLVKG